MSDRVTRSRPADAGAPEAPTVDAPAAAEAAVPEAAAVVPAASPAVGGPVAVPASAPGTAPAGPSLTDAADPTRPPGGIGWAAAWAKVAVQVDPDHADVIVNGDGDRVVTVTGPAGARDVLLEGQQITLRAGETLPPATAVGEGSLLHSVGAVRAVDLSHDDDDDD